jgi:hypothetical protein
MMPLVDVSIRNIMPLNGGTASIDGNSLILMTDPRLWAWSAQIQFEIPEIDRSPRAIAVGLEVERGTLAIGWLQADEQEWIAQSSATPSVGATILRVVVPAGTLGGKLVFINWTAGGEPALGRVTSIEIMPVSDADMEFFAAQAAEERGDAEVAIERYRAALLIDPSHVESIVGLGRLRFVPPKQPLLEEMKCRAPPGDYCGVVIAIRNPCNYRCFYCVGAGMNNVPVKLLNFDKIKRHYDSIECVDIGTAFECGGGEPTVHPQFSELLRFCTQYGEVEFPTNNSQNPRRWLPRDVASRLEIRAALHPEGEEKLLRYLDYAKFLLDVGCRFRCDFIAHPTRLHQVEHYANVFEKSGVPFVVIPFIGTYEGNSYPHAFTEDEKLIMMPYAPRNSTWGTYVRISSAVNRIRNFRGISCLSGYRSVYIDQESRMHRCLYDPHPIEARLKRATTCNVKHCGCGVPLENLSFDQTGFWPKLADLDPFARRLGYEDAEAGVAAEYVEMYDALMTAYGKEEFPE